MNRELTTHIVTDADAYIHVRTDELGNGGASHDYTITLERDGSSLELARILFQNGPIGEVGMNGLTHEVLLSIVIDRLEHFQLGKFPSRYNADALMHCQYARAALMQRTKDRIAAGVEGKMVAFDPKPETVDAPPAAPAQYAPPQAVPGPDPRFQFGE